MTHNNLKLFSMIAGVGIAIACFMHPSAKTAKTTTPAQRSLGPVATADATRDPRARATPPGAWRKAPGGAEAAATLGAADHHADHAREGDGAGGNGPDDPEAYPGAEAPPEASANGVPAHEGTGGNGAAVDPQVYPGAEAPPAASAVHARYDGTAATGAPAPAHHNEG
jgi:hypothetical protein